jgi:hypothetical protein
MRKEQQAARRLPKADWKTRRERETCDDFSALSNIVPF